MRCTNWDNGAHFDTLSLKVVMMLHLVVHTKTNRSSCVKSSREKFKPCMLSHLHSPGQSPCKVDLISDCVLHKLSDASGVSDAVRQVLHLKHTEAL